MLSQKQEQRRQPEKAKASEKRVLGIIPPDIREAEGFVRTQHYVTPAVLAERFGIRLSVAKRLLTALAERGSLRHVEGVTGLKLYNPTGEVKAPRKVQAVQRAAEVETEEAQVQQAKGKKKKAKK
jgi:ribosomal protein S25